MKIGIYDPEDGGFGYHFYHKDCKDSKYYADCKVELVTIGKNPNPDMYDLSGYEVIGFKCEVCKGQVLNENTHS